MAHDDRAYAGNPQGCSREPLSSTASAFVLDAAKGGVFAMDEAQMVGNERGDGQRGTVRAAAVDLLLVLATLLAVKAAMLGIDALWTYAGPVSLLAAVLVAHWRLRANGEGWGDLGLRRPARPGRMAMWAAVLLIVTIAAGIAIESLIPSITGIDTNAIDPRYAGRFAAVPGSLPHYLYWMIISWVIGAFAEEMLFRGMLVSRFERLFAGWPTPVVIAVILQAVLFGQQHLYYQGLNGALATGGIALISGIFYMLLKRTLWPLILSHGLANSIGLTLLYAGMQPAG